MGEPSTQSFATRFTQRAETPPRAKLTAGSSYRLSDLKTQRKTLIEELGPTIPEVPIPYFLTNILPGLREGLDVDEIATKFKASGHITDDGRWSCFPCDPAQVKKREEQCFQPLEQLAEAISTASGGGKHATPTLHAKPFHTTCLHAQGHEESRWVYWANIAMSAEFKKKARPADKEDNVAKIIWSMHQCMREDPRRRFTFGLTIENKEIRLWFCTRAQLLVSEGINFLQDHATVIHLFLALMYAKDHEVGWDPTICYARDRNGEVLLHDGVPRLDITIHEDGEEPETLR
ncbi:hypothetical protein POSPLADRAFT_1061121 [Postia placenta MAD-698-R-SB12]|uniref:Fungal-type protein kinase domain-containing protein n=1 Tax=Postia placenta MAD-698-R-SB12 TaxID=670580 RepID=A0A1X6MNT2_9APHY|nr:hypothetical protein POSPLADRAFT_1061121 [Postia placenta MAD-698-R-SB12]OSX58035.1 hypothetical protein POSPLADRAFT_1061121 [Postia placenta MAD-698-R-SB12]